MLILLLTISLILHELIESAGQGYECFEIEFSHLRFKIALTHAQPVGIRKSAEITTALWIDVA